MRVLSDFDGVLTDITHEAARVTNLFLDTLRTVAGGDEHAVAGLAHSGYEEMAANPAQHGWRVAGRITAFANEDGFIRINGLAACLDDRAARGDATARALSDGLGQRGLAGFAALAQQSYEQMVRETAAGKIKPLDPGAAEVLKELLGRGDEVVVVSNSGTVRISQLLRGAGIEPNGGNERGPGRLRVRGGARKFILGGSPRILDVGPYRVPIDRPHYEEILREERPDVVVGDVFSLDLALPLASARDPGAPFGRPRLFLRRRPYTPAWSVDWFAAQTLARCEVVERMEQIL